MNKKAIATVVVVLVVVTLVGVAIWRHAENAKHVTVDGTIECDEISVSSKIPGRIEKLFVDEGAPVKPGDPLAILESQEIDAKVDQASAGYQATMARVSESETAVKLQQATYSDQLAEAEAAYAARSEDIHQAEENLNQARAAYKTASDTYKRFQGLFADGVIPEQTEQECEYRYLAAKAQLGAAESKLTQAKQAVKASASALQLARDSGMQVDLRRAEHDAATQQAASVRGQLNEALAYQADAKIVSPVSGYVSERVSNAGEAVSPGFPILTIVRANDFKVKIYVDESKYGHLQLGRQIKVIIPALNNEAVYGRLIRISQSADFATKKATNEQGSFDVRGIQLVIGLNDDSRFRNGMTARVVLDEDAQ
ncbi:MAG: efflux RND transporter periplasmic adaptor subunit [Terracidiphilus sp.]